MLEIDGSAGGQVLRTSVALSALVGKGIVVRDIRSQREQPGIKAQHLAAVESVAKACGAEVDGCEVGSREIMFKPGEIRGGRVRVNISTAGSVGLVMQALLPIYLLSGKPSTIEIYGGGTAGKWSPPVDYMENVFLEIMRMHGAHVETDVRRHGFYPKGGAEVVVRVKGPAVDGIKIVEGGGLVGIDGVSVASSDLAKARVADRQKMAAMKEFGDADISPRYVGTLSAGSYVVLRALFEKTVVGADMLGKRGLPSEAVGKRCAELLKSRLNDVVDPHAADNLIPYIAFAGGKVICSHETEHIKNNIRTCSRFGLDVKMEGGVISGEGA
jgi:RNA 3'-terminal phosphate cyclase (ATP)